VSHPYGLRKDGHWPIHPVTTPKAGWFLAAPPFTILTKKSHGKNTSGKTEPSELTLTSMLPVLGNNFSSDLFCGGVLRREKKIVNYRALGIFHG
jgi:hypothetical protein